MGIFSEIEGIIFMTSWNTDGGVFRHALPIVDWMVKKGYRVKVLTHYRETPHGFNLNVEDEEFVERCYTLQGKRKDELRTLNTEIIFDALKEGYNLFVAEDLGMLPMEELLEIFPRIKKKAKTILVNHDNLPKPDGSIFWKFDWDCIINFLEYQMDFMAKHYPRDRLYFVEFPTFPKPNIVKNKVELRSELDLPKDKKIVLLFGEYDFIDSFEVLGKYRKEHDDTFLLCLVYTEDQKNLITRTLEEKFGESYDDVRIEISSWENRAKYVMASDLVVLDKGKKKFGKGAVLSSTAFQIIGWGTPIIARNSRYFDVFGDSIVTYENDDDMFEKIGQLLNDSEKRRETLKKQEKFHILHNPERISTKFIWIFRNLLTGGFKSPNFTCGKLRRIFRKPLFTARKDLEITSENGEKVRWERLVYNSAAFKVNGIVYLIYRALGFDGISRFGLWISEDGLKETLRLDHPIFGPREDYESPRNLNERVKEHLKFFGHAREIGGVEDPRITVMGDTIYMLYTAYGDTPKLSIAKMKLCDFLRAIECGFSYEEWQSLWIRGGPIFDFEDKDGVLFFADSGFSFGDSDDSQDIVEELAQRGAFLIHRIPPDMQILRMADLRKGSVGETFEMPRPGSWDSLKIGAGAPPLKTKYGFLHIFHGVGLKNGTAVYSLGSILTALDDPSKVIYVSPDPILEPEEDYEINGWVPNVVFTCGAVPRFRDSGDVLDGEDEILVYYGGADEVMSVATAKVRDLIPTS